MTTLVLDRTLKEVEWDDTHYPRPQVKKKIEAGCLAKSAVERDWNTKTDRPAAASIVRSVPRPSLLPASKNLHKNDVHGTLSTPQLAV
jgi:hypothetical protein